MKVRPILHLLTLLCSAGTAASVHSAVYTVGPAGTHATIQAAINAALVNPGDDEIRVHIGTYAEGINVPATMNTDTLEIKGGYADGYLTIYRDGAVNTIIQPPAGARGANLAPSGGTLKLQTVTITGSTTTSCAGLRIDGSGGAGVEVNNAYIHDNLVDTNGTGIAIGGGACLEGKDNATVVLSKVDISNNIARVTGAVNSNASGGGLRIYCIGSAHCYLADSQLNGNRIEPKANNGQGAGLAVQAGESAVVAIVRTVFGAQQVGGTPGAIDGVAAYVAATGSANAVVTQSRFHGGTAPGGVTLESEVALYPASSATMDFDNSLITHSSARAMKAATSGNSTLFLAALTVADNAYPAEVQGNSAVSALVYNNIFWNPATATNIVVSGSIVEDNLIGVDPGFVAPSLYDYSLRRSGSPAMNLGSTTRPLGSYDIADTARVQNGRADIGAWESSDRIFSDRIDP